jgi:TolB-like protein/tetratricopeptide (TPR) repeat protein
MAVLQCLAGAQGEVVSRNDILDAVWPGAEVTDDVLTHSLTELRKAFGDSPHDPSVIETIPKKGLRLMLMVSGFEETDGRLGGWRFTGRAASRVWLLAGLVAVSGLVAWFLAAERGGDLRAAATIVEKSIAVLPFVDLSTDQDQRYLADGLAEEITIQLSRVDGLLVYGPRLSGVLAKADAGEPGNQPGPSPDYMLGGSIRRSGDVLRVTATLAAAEDGLQLWAHTFERPYTELFEIQDEIAFEVASALRVELSVGDPRRLVGGTSNIAAFEHVMAGDAGYDLTPEGMEQAIDHYSAAARLDPDYAVAWERIAMYYNEVHITRSGSPTDDEMRLADEAIARAMSLAPESEAVLLTAADIQLSRNNWIEAKRLFERAEELYAEPLRDLLGQRGWWAAHFHMYLRLGYSNELIDRLEPSRRAGTLPLKIGGILPHAYLSQGRFEDAVAELERVAASLPHNVHVDFLHVLVALSMGDRDAIRARLRRAVEYGAEPDQAMLEFLFDDDRALAWLHQAYETHTDWDYWITAWASYYGDDDLALKALKRTPDTWLFWLPLTSGLRETKDFRNLVDDMGMVDYWRQYGWNDYCRPTDEVDFVCS